jgi:asparagine synthase (glutamine-hydrolysing)
MCGICGLAARPGAPAPDGAVLRRMNASIAHRGPDADGFWEDGGVALGQRRLSIIDVAGGDNPLHDRDRRLALMYNGEVYNHLALRRELEAAGHRPLSGSDGEVVLHGYRQWGLTGMLSRLRGMYAFALHDRDTGELHLARDPLGIKPLHLALTPQGLVFGSEVKAVPRRAWARARGSTRARCSSARRWASCSRRARSGRASRACRPAAGPPGGRASCVAAVTSSCAGSRAGRPPTPRRSGRGCRTR